MTRISVIVPVYNGEKYVRECLNSIVNQTLSGIEIVVVNDGSTDGTGKILEEFEKKYSNIIIYEQENKGLYASRKKGLELATGEYVGWVDADDFIDYKMYEILYDAVIQNDSELAYCDYSWFPQPIKTKAKWFREYKNVVDVEFIERNSQPWNKLVKRQLLIELNIGELFLTCFDEAYIKVLLHAKNPISVNMKLYSYRVGNGSMSSTYTNVEHYKRFVVASKELEKELMSENQYWNEYFRYRIIYYILQTMLVAANAKERKLYETFKVQLEEMDMHNRHMVTILNRNFGKIKSFGIRKCVPLGYAVARIMSVLAFNRIF